MTLNCRRTQTNKTGINSLLKYNLERPKAQPSQVIGHQTVICGASFFTVTDLKFSMASSKSSTLDTAPNIPPSIFTDSIALMCRDGSLAAVPSSRTTQSNPRSLASRMVVDTQTSLVTPAMTRFLTPLFRRRSSKSVCAKALRPGLSMTGSPGIGYSSSTVSWPGSPRTRRRPRGPGEPMPTPEALFRERYASLLESVDRSGRWPQAEVSHRTANAEGDAHPRVYDTQETRQNEMCAEGVGAWE